MRRLFTGFCATALAFGGSLMLASLSSASTNDKVTICHFPPGNPATFQTITISASALPAHLAHGDFPDSCANDCRLFDSACEAPDLCTDATCNPLTGLCETAPKSCDDGLDCTADSCNSADGSCQHTQICCSYDTSGTRTACDVYRNSLTCQQCLQAQCPVAVTACNDAAVYSCGCASGCAYGNPGCAAEINACSQCASACCPG